MPSSTRSSVSKMINATVQCEGCDHVYPARAFVMAMGYQTGASQKSAEGAKEDAVKQLQKKLEKINQGDLKDLKGDKACPECGYVQSWMLNENRRSKSEDSKLYKFINMIFALTGAFAFFGSFFVWLYYESAFVGIAAIALSVVVMFLPRIYMRRIYNPNSAWLKERGLSSNEAPAPRPPVEMVPF